MWKKLLPLLCLALLIGLAGCSGPTDADGDGLNKTVEERNGLSDQAIDTDGDGLNDTREYRSDRLNGTRNDTDEDGLLDGQELAFGSDPSEKDTDGDGATDEEEKRAGSDPVVEDSDEDGLVDGIELKNGASPTKTDTDGDGLTDKQEVRETNTHPGQADSDDDGLSDKEETHLVTSPRSFDTDGDGVPDEAEVTGTTNATLADTDGDGLSDGIEAPPGSASSPFNATRVDTDGDRLNDSVEYRIGTDPSTNDTDGDGREDAEEYNASGLDPTQREVRVVEGSPEAGWANATLRTETRKTVEFLSDLPKNRTKRNRTVTTAATDICNAHSRVVPEKAANATGVDGKVYRNTYRIAHTAKVMQGIGADIDDGTIQGRMRAAREYSGLASKYAPVVGSYQRLHIASCAVKRGEPGAKEDFYIASAEFAVDLVLIKEGVVYKAAFRTTGVASRTVGLNRLARVCGYKCVGLVQSELHWVVRGTYSGALDGVAREATEGNLTTEEWNESTRREVGAYVGNSTSATQIGSKLVPESKVIDCVSRNLGLGNLWKLRDELSKDGLEAIQTILREQTLPEDVDLSFLTDINKVDRCLGG